MRALECPAAWAVTVNGHASEVAGCTFEEQVRVLDITHGLKD